MKCLAVTTLLMVANQGWANDIQNLFTSQETLRVSLSLPLKTLLKNKDDKTRVSGLLLINGQTIEVGVIPRGKSRLARCKFPPLWLDLKKKQTTGTPFAGQNRLKLVTHCADNLESRGYLAAEMLTYRLFNLITPYSYRVRALTITYTDTDSGKNRTHHGFVIEHKKQLAKRLELELLDTPKLRLADLDTTYTSLANTFQYMIGNTDFSFSQGPPGDDCCHNTTPVKDLDERVFSIPYDFDSSGIVNPPYAVPAENLGLRRLTQRKFRGFCRHNQGLQQSRDRFIDLQNNIRQTIEEFDEIPHLNRPRVAKFIEGFYKTLSNDRSYSRKIESACRKGKR